MFRDDTCDPAALQSEVEQLAARVRLASSLDARWDALERRLRSAVDLYAEQLVIFTGICLVVTVLSVTAWRSVRRLFADLGPAGRAKALRRKRHLSNSDAVEAEVVGALEPVYPAAFSSHMRWLLFVSVLYKLVVFTATYGVTAYLAASSMWQAFVVDDPVLFSRANSVGGDDTQSSSSLLEAHTHIGGLVRHGAYLLLRFTNLDAVAAQLGALASLYLFGAVLAGIGGVLLRRDDPVSRAFARHAAVDARATMIGAAVSLGAAADTTESVRATAIRQAVLCDRIVAPDGRLIDADSSIVTPAAAVSTATASVVGGTASRRVLSATRRPSRTLLPGTPSDSSTSPRDWPMTARTVVPAA